MNSSSSCAFVVHKDAFILFGIDGIFVVQSSGFLVDFIEQICDLFFQFCGDEGVVVHSVMHVFIVISSEPFVILQIGILKPIHGIVCAIAGKRRNRFSLVRICHWRRPRGKMDEELDRLEDIVIELVALFHSQQAIQCGASLTESHDPIEWAKFLIHFFAYEARSF